MAKRRKLKRNEHRYNGRIVRKTPKQFKVWHKDRYYDRRLRVWIREPEEPVRAEEPLLSGTQEPEEQEPDVETEREKQIKKDMIERFDEWAKENMKGYGFQARRDILAELEQTRISDEHDGYVDLDAEHTAKNDDIKGKFIKMRLDLKQRTIKIVLNEGWHDEIKEVDDDAE